VDTPLQINEFVIVTDKGEVFLAISRANSMDFFKTCSFSTT
jgi:hypothetical protein